MRGDMMVAARGARSGMDYFQRTIKQIRFFARFPEMRVFWVLAPLLLLTFVLIVAGVLKDSTIPLVLGWIFVVCGGLVFASSYSAAKTNYGTSVERNALKSIVAGIDDALISYDRDFRVFYFNPAAEKLFGIKAEAVLDQALTPQIAERPEFRLLAQVVFPSLAPTLIYRSRAGTYPQVADLSFDEPLLELRTTTSPLLDEKGNVAGFMKIIHNRTQEVSLLKSKNEFITVASHQLRTPITEVTWALETLVHEESLNPGTRDLVVQTGVSAKKILNIVEDLLSIAKIEEGRFGYNFQEIDIVKYLDEILAGTMPQVERAGLKLYFDRPKEQLATTHIDSQKISMALSNLIDNAVRYNIKNGQIIVKVRVWPDDNRFLELSVKDTGIGIPAGEIKNMFTKFFRATNAVKFQTDGSGLGLYIAKNIVQAHGGQMWAESEEARGSTFYITLPIDPTMVPAREIAVGM